MTFLAIDAQKNLFTLQKNQLQFEQMLILNQVNWCQKQQTQLQRAYNAGEYGEDADIEKDTYYMQLQDMDEQLSTRKSAIEDQITALTEEITSCSTLVKNNVKQSCGLNLIGG